MEDIDLKVFMMINKKLKVIIIRIIIGIILINLIIFIDEDILIIMKIEDLREIDLMNIINLLKDINK